MSTPFTQSHPPFSFQANSGANARPHMQHPRVAQPYCFPGQLPPRPPPNGPKLTVYTGRGRSSNYRDLRALHEEELRRYSRNQHQIMTSGTPRGQSQLGTNPRLMSNQMTARPFNANHQRQMSSPQNGGQKVIPISWEELLGEGGGMQLAMTSPSRPGESPQIRLAPKGELEAGEKPLKIMSIKPAQAK